MIPLGFEVGTGRRVSIPLAHLAVAGQTQASGKTTTLEALISRSGLRAVAFVTKRGEASFRSAAEVPAFFSEPSNTAETPLWEWVKSILEAVQQQKMGFKEAWIIRASEGAETLSDVHTNIRQALKKSKSGFSADMYKCLDAYFNRVLPTINRLPRTRRLNLGRGLTVMNLTDYPEPVQALVIRSVIEWVYAHEKGTIVVIPEAWKFIPRDRGGPVKLAAAHLIREGAALRNFVWIDSQDLAMVHTEILKSIGVWILGVQWERNEVKRMLDYIPVNPKIKPHQIMQLGRGQFYVCHGRETPALTYVQPFWVPDVHAQAIAKGIEPVESAERIWKETRRTAEDAEAAEETVFQTPKPQPLNPPQSPAPHSPLDTPSGDPSAAVESTEPAAAADGPTTEQELSGALYEHLKDVADDAVAEECERIVGEAKALSEDEAMWKEKCEALEKEVARLRAELAGQPFKRADRVEAPKPRNKDDEILLNPGVPQSLGGIYNYVKQRATEDPGILEILASRPELRVKIERTTIQMDGATLEGRIALLLHEGFCDKGATGEALVREVKRRGYGKLEGRAVGMFYMKLAKFAEQGFLTVETQDGTGPKAVYSIVPEMKKSIVRG